MQRSVRHLAVLLTCGIPRKYYLHVGFLVTVTTSFLARGVCLFLAATLMSYMTTKKMP
jgi:hypothetical protein